MQDTFARSTSPRLTQSKVHQAKTLAAYHRPDKAARAAPESIAHFLIIFERIE